MSVKFIVPLRLLFLPPVILTVLIWISKVGDLRSSAKTVEGMSGVKNIKEIIEVIRYINFIFEYN